MRYHLTLAKLSATSLIPPPAAYLILMGMEYMLCDILLGSAVQTIRLVLKTVLTKIVHKQLDSSGRETEKKSIKLRKYIVRLQSAKRSEIRSCAGS